MKAAISRMALGKIKQGMGRPRGHEPSLIHC